MSRITYFCLGLLLALLIAQCAGCAWLFQMSDSWCDAHPQASPNRCVGHEWHDPEQSWDQENLKRNDHGCPRAIFIAPGGELEQC